MNNEEHILIIKAQKSSCVKELKKLSQSPYSKVRRSVAKNENTSREIINILAFDKVLNIAAIASTHPKCNINKYVDISNPCIFCNVEEKNYHLECNEDSDCERIEKLSRLIS